MNRLECQVTSCQHYSSGLCCLPGIRVDGPAAQESSQTCCASYQERTPGSAENALGRQPTPESSIHCEAEHCRHNDSCECLAEHVCVGCSCGCASSKSGTECCTFEHE